MVVPATDTRKVPDWAAELVTVRLKVTNMDAKRREHASDFLVILGSLGNYSSYNNHRWIKD